MVLSFKRRDRDSYSILRTVLKVFPSSEILKPGLNIFKPGLINVNTGVKRAKKTAKI